MFIRRKRNQSGSISIQVLQKQKGRNKLIKTIGSSSEELEIEILVHEAKRFIEEQKGQLPISLAEEKTNNWFTDSFDQIKNIQLIGPELVLGKIFNDIGFNQIRDPLFRDLVLCRIVYPSSKLKTTRYLLETQNKSYSIKQVYKYLDKLHSKQKEVIQSISYSHTIEILGSAPSVVFYDVTTIYFEAEKEDDLRRMGFSKEGKHRHPQILLGLLVSKGGYPMAYEIFEGNKYEGHTLMPVLEVFKERYSLDELIVVADSGLLTKSNISQLKKK